MRKSTTSLQACLQRYADLVIAPTERRISRYLKSCLWSYRDLGMSQHLSVGQLHAVRLHAAQTVLHSCPELASDLVEMTKGAPRGLPFNFTTMDAWRIAVDQTYIQRRQGGTT